MPASIPSDPAALAIARQLQEWRSKVLEGIFRGTLLFAFLALVGGLNTAFHTYEREKSLVPNAPGIFVAVLAFYLTAFILLAFVTFNRKLPYRLRAAILLLVYYGLAALNLSFSALSGDGRVLLFAVVALAAILFDLRYSLGALALSLLTLAGFGWLEVTGRIVISAERQLNATSAESWISGGVVFLLLGVAVLIPADYLLRMLARTLAHSHTTLTREQRLSRILRTVSDINQLIVRERARDRLLNEACEILVRGREYTFAWIGLLAEDGVTTHLAAASGPAAEAFASWQSDSTRGLPCAPAALRARAPMRVEPGEHDLCPTCPLLAQYPHRSAVVLSLISNDHVFGSLEVVHTAPSGSFDDEEIRLLQELANDLAFALESMATAAANDRLLAAERDQHQLTEALRATNVALTSTLDFETLLDQLLQHIARVIPYDAANVFMVEQGRTRHLLMRGYEQFGPEVVEAMLQFSLTIDRTPNTQRMAATGRPHFISDTALDPEWVNVVPQIRSWVGAPIIVGGELIAYISLDKQEPNFYQPQHVERLMTFVGQTALILRNAQLFEALEQREAYFRTLVENSAEGVAILDAQGNFRYVAPAEERLSGYAPQTLIGQSAFRFIHPDDIPNLLQAFQTGLQTPGAVATMEYRLQRKDGAWRHFEVTGQNLLDDPHMAGVVLNYRDITERVQAEAALREHEQHSQALLRLSKKLERSQTHAEALNAALEEVRHIIGYKNLWVYLFTEDGKYAKSFMAGGGASDIIMSEEGAATLTIEGDRMLEEIAEATEIVVVEDARIDERTDKALVERLGNRTIVNVPIILFDKHLGAVGAGTFGDEGVLIPTAAEREFLSALASHMAVTLDRIHLLAERARAEAQLRQLSRAVEQSPASVMITDIVGNIEYVNPKFTQVSGYPRAEAVGRNPRFLKSGETPPEEYRRLWAAISSGGQWQGEFHNRKKNGDLYWEAVLISPVVDETGQTTHYLAVKEDITARKEAEEALRASEMNFRTLAENIPSVVYQCKNDATYTFLYLNDAIEDLTGYPKQAFLSGELTAFDLYHPDDVKLMPVPTPENAATLNRAPFHLTYRFRHKSGEWRWVDEWGIGVTNPQGEVQYLQGVMIDITARVQAEDAVRQREAYFRALIENAPDGIAIVDAQAIFRYFSPAVERILGYPPAELLGQDAFDFIHPEDAPGLLEKTRTGIQMVGVFETVEFRFRHRSGGWVHLEGIAHNLFDDPAVQGVVINYHDITERKNAEAALRQRADELEALVATSLALRTAFQVAPLIPVVVRQALKVVNGDYGEVFLLESETGDLISSGGYAVDENSVPQLPLKTALRHRPGEGITGHVALTGQIYITNDLPHDSLAHILPEEAERLSVIQSGIALPLRAHERVIGVLHLWLRAQRGFSETEIRLLTAIAEMASAAIHRAALYEQAERHAAELIAALTREQRLNEVARVVSSTLNSEIILQSVMRLAVELTAADAGTIGLVVPGEPPLLVCRHHHFRVPPEVDAIPEGEDVGWRIIATGRTTVLENYSADPHAQPDLVAAGARGFLGVPLSAGDERLGMLGLFMLSSARQFTLRDQALAEAVGQEAGVAIQNSRRYHDLQARNAELERAVRRAKALAIAAEEANRLKSEFLANTSHELRTPVTVIIGALDVLLNNMTDTAQERQEFLQMAFHAAQGLREIVEQVLDMMRLEAQKMDVRLQACDVALIAEEVRWKVQPAALAKNLALVVQMPPQLPRAWADPDKVRQILLILVENAVKFTEAGSVSVTVEPPGAGAEQLCLVVSDTGIGIPLERQAKLFQPFVQADGSHTRTYGGLGLGLSISRRLAELMGGALTLYSAGLGQGTTITLALPLVSGG